MANSRAVSHEAREYIKEQIFELGVVNVDEVVKMLKPHYNFDPGHSELREMTNYARRLLSSLKSADGCRVALSVSDNSGRFVNIETCENRSLMQKIDRQIDMKWKGLTRTRDKVKTRLLQIEGQTVLHDQQSGDIAEETTR